MISPSMLVCTPRAVLALEPAGPETSEDVDDDPDRISKIRARQSTRNKLVVTAMVADRRASATREQEVVPRKVGHIPRHNLKAGVEHGRRDCSGGPRSGPEGGPQGGRWRAERRHREDRGRRGRGREGELGPRRGRQLLLRPWRYVHEAGVPNRAFGAGGCDIGPGSDGVLCCSGPPGRSALFRASSPAPRDGHALHRRSRGNRRGADRASVFTHGHRVGADAVAARLDTSSSWALPDLDRSRVDHVLQFYPCHLPVFCSTSPRSSRVPAGVRRRAPRKQRRSSNRSPASPWRASVAN